MNFPEFPSFNQVYTYQGRSWRFNGIGWVAVAGPLPIASTTVAGIVQLEDTLSSVSTATAPTANALRVAYEVLNTDKASINSPAFTGTPTTTSPPIGDSSQRIATTGFVKAQGYASLNSPAFSGAPTAATPSLFDNSTRLATTGYVQGQGFTTQSWVNSQGFATQSYVQSQGFASQSYVQSQGYVTQSTIDASGYTTSFYVDNQISSAVASVQDWTLGYFNLGALQIYKYALCRYDKGNTVEDPSPGAEGGLENNELVPASEILVTRFLADGTLATAGMFRPPAGTWRNMGTTVFWRGFSLFQRVA